MIRYRLKAMKLMCFVFASVWIVQAMKSFMKYYNDSLYFYGSDVLLMNEFELIEHKNLQFIDEFPVVSESLTNIVIEGTRHYSVVIDEIKKGFRNF